MAIDERPPDYRFTVTGLEYHRYGEYKRSLMRGVALKLVTDFNNIHDRNAIKVCVEGAQIGWIPKRHNQALADDLRNGKKFDAWVEEHQAHGQLNVAVRSKAGVAPLTTLLFDVLQEPSGTSGKVGALARSTSGVTWALRSAAPRTSVSVVSTAGNDLAWFYKSPLKESVIDLIDDGHCVMQLGEQQGQRVMYIYQKGTEPKSVPASILTDGSLTDGSITATTIQPQTQKENTMALNSNTISNAVSTTIDFNKKAASAAGYLEAGRIANNKVGPLVSKALPLMLRGYADTPAGKLVIANIARMAAQQLRPTDKTLDNLTLAMTTAAYQEALQQIDFEGMLDSLLDSKEIKRAISKLDAE